MDNIKKNNHYVPQFYLKNFSFNGKEVFMYRTLVSNSNVRPWNIKSISSIGKQVHLYTQIINGEESDEFENYFEKEYETPVQDAYYNAINDKKLNSNDWERMIKFIASQILRTPAAYFKHLELMGKIVPRALNELADNIVNRNHSESLIGDNDKQYSYFIERFPFCVERDKEKEIFNVSADIGRKSWLVSAKHILTKLSSILLAHRWSIVDVHNGTELFTSDDPVICLNYYNRGNYDFKGGWGNVNSEIIFPISPSKIIYTRVGKKDIKSKSNFNFETSEMIKRFIAEHSYRYIYSKTEQKYMKKYRPRIVSNEIYRQEKEAWENWHTYQR